MARHYVGVIPSLLARFVRILYPKQILLFTNRVRVANQVM